MRVNPPGVGWRSELVLAREASVPDAVYQTRRPRNTGELIKLTATSAEFEHVPGSEDAECDQARRRPVPDCVGIVGQLGRRADFVLGLERFLVVDPVRPVAVQDLERGQLRRSVSRAVRSGCQRSRTR